MRFVPACVFIFFIHLDFSLATTYNLNWSRSVNNQGTTTIGVGDTVRWTITDTSTHTVESSGNFDSGTISGSGTTFSHTFNSAGSFSYSCGIHGNMRGTIVVVAPDPTNAPISSPTFAPTQTPVLNSTPAPTSPSAVPTVSPTPTPTSSPTIDLSGYLANLLSAPQVIYSGVDAPAEWSVTLYVREHRHVNDKVGFNTRSYCYNDLCSYPGPTIEIHPGDNLTLTLINELESAAVDEHGHNELHGANLTNIHTHGLHIDPNVDSIFVKAGPGESLTYEYQLPLSHAPGLHWYHAHHHGSSSMQLMGGLVGALIVTPFNTSGNPTLIVEQNISTSILESNSYLLVVTQLFFSQETSGDGSVTQGCGVGWACDADTQGPLCTGKHSRFSIRLV